MVYYFNPNKEGIIETSSLGDGYTINVKWNKAYAKNANNKVAYHIYMSTEVDNVFSEGVKYVSTGTNTSVDILDLVPGQLYHFAVRALEYNPILFDITQLPKVFNDLIIYPETLLISDISKTDLRIKVLDTETFPPYGVVQLGYELINYLSVDEVNKELILTNESQRGFFNSVSYFHDTDGYDGYRTLFPPIVRFTLGREEQNTRIFQCQNRFEYPNYQFTILDGYHQVTKDILTTDLSASDNFNQNFPTYDFAGYHRTNPSDLLTGVCIGSYIGGQMYCADGYNGVGRLIRGVSLQDQNNQRQEILLNLTGKPVVLIKWMTTGITCACYTPGQEYPDDRCPKCFGKKFVSSYKQFFNPRRSDGRILVRFSPADDDLVMQEAGLESTFTTDCWTLTVPTIKDRDIIVNFDEDGNEEFRYEVLSVNRNNTIEGLQGAQKFRVQRIRKTDIAYQIPVNYNTEFIPAVVATGLGSTTGIPPHSHTINISSNVKNLGQINQLTSVEYGHNHVVRGGVVQEILGHSHEIILK